MIHAHPLGGTPARVAELKAGDVVVHLGRARLITRAAHHDEDGLSLVSFQDGRWLHCMPDTLLARLRPGPE